MLISVVKIHGYWGCFVDSIAKTWRGILFLGHHHRAKACRWFSGKHKRPEIWAPKIFSSKMWYKTHSICLGRQYWSCCPGTTSSISCPFLLSVHFVLPRESVYSFNAFCLIINDIQQALYCTWKASNYTLNLWTTKIQLEVNKACMSNWSLWTPIH